MTTLPPMPPLRVDAVGPYYVVHDALDRTVAQGSFELCSLVAAGCPIFTEQGDLFDAVSV